MSRTDDRIVDQVGVYVPDPPDEQHKFQGGQYMGKEEVCSECIGVENAPQHTLDTVAETEDHRWSGWPGAWCLDCGTDDARESCLADVHRSPEHRKATTGDDRQYLGDHICQNDPCPEPGSRNHDPYSQRD
ncbi:hypothetical protein LCGC14_0810400 [marine sediment metagenome]|uniref:Uncharacterized protein n=1 Tax=marine sediment metagenome TaxID=412755 RepID=A0A0F9S6Y3_9ZZZZ